MELNHLKVFFEVAKSGKFTEAAKNLHISQSALSRSVAIIEEQLQHKLFDRSHQGVSLTLKGEEVFAYCTQIFNHVEKISNLKHGEKYKLDGPLQFATGDHILNYLLSNSIFNFKRKYSNIIPSIITGTSEEILNNVQNESCEFGLLFTKIPNVHINYKELKEEPMSLVVKKELWEKYKSKNSKNSINNLLQATGYISSIGAQHQTRPSKVILELFGHMPKISFETNGQEAQKRLCLNGLGIAYLANFMVKEEIKSELLHDIQIDTKHSFKLWIAMKKGKILSDTAKAFMELVMSTKYTDLSLDFKKAAGSRGDRSIG